MIPSTFPVLFPSVTPNSFLSTFKFPIFSSCLWFLPQFFLQGTHRNGTTLRECTCCEWLGYLSNLNLPDPKSSSRSHKLYSESRPATATTQIRKHKTATWKPPPRLCFSLSTARLHPASWNCPMFARHQPLRDSTNVVNGNLFFQ